MELNNMTRPTKMVNGQVIELTDEEISNLPSTYSSEQIAQFEKEKQINIFKSERDRKINETFLVNINSVDFPVNRFDLELITSITEHLQEQTGTASHKWTNINGDSVDLPASAFSVMRQAILERTQEARHTYNLQVKTLSSPVILNFFSPN